MLWVQPTFFYSTLDVVEQFLYLNLAGFRVVTSLIVGETRHLPWTQENRIVYFRVLAFLAVEPLARLVSTATIIAVEPTVFHLAWTQRRTDGDSMSISKAGKHTNILDRGISPFVIQATGESSTKV